MNFLISQVQILNATYQQQNQRLLDILNSTLKRPFSGHTKIAPQSHYNNSQIQDSIDQTCSSKNKAKNKSSLSNSRKTLRNCSSCLNTKNIKSTNPSTLLSSKNKQKHDQNMSKLKKLSSRMIPKVSNQWLFQHKSKIHHFKL